LARHTNLPRAPMVDTAAIVGRAFGATSGSFRAQNAHATPVWGTLPASSRAPMVDMNTIVGRAFGATSDLPRAPMVDTTAIVGRAFGATRGSFRAQDAHATPVWGTLPASSRAPMVDTTAIVGRAFGATSGIAPCAKCARYVAISVRARPAALAR